MSPVRMSKLESGIRAVIEFKDAFNRRDVEGMMSLLSEDCVFESANGPEGTIYRGKEEIANYWRAYLSERPNLRLIGEEVFGFGIRCVLRWKTEWEDEEGNLKYFKGADIFQFTEGYISKYYSYTKA